MAISSSTLTSSLPRVFSTKTCSTSILPSFHLTQSQRPAKLRSIRCQLDQGTGNSEPQQATPPPTVTSPPPPPPTPKAPAVSTKLWDILAFGGPAPERINGRLAMVGFVAALAVELARGDELAVQLSNGGVAWFVGTAAVLSVASVVPLVQGVTAQSRSGGVMTSEAEMWNGRFAMLGLVALAFTEYLKAGPLI